MDVAGSTGGQNSGVLGHEIGRKLSSKNPQIRGKLAKLRLGNANKGGGDPKATDPWIKTTKNSSNQPNRSNPKMAIFGGNFQFLKTKKNLVDLWGKQNQIRGNLEL